MKAKLKQKWIEALESGRYTQGIGMLRWAAEERQTEYCCLGVLAEQLGCTWVDGSVPLFADGWHNCKSTELDPWVRDTIQLSDTAQTKLMRMNDGRNEPQRDFKYIAQWLRDNKI